MTREGQFPHAVLTPYDAQPRITVEQAARLLELTAALDDINKAGQECAPALMVAFFCKGPVKYVVNGAEAQDTIDNMERALAGKFQVSETPTCTSTTTD